MSEKDQKRKSGPAILTSVLPSTADIGQRGGHVRKVPKGDEMEEPPIEGAYLKDRSCGPPLSEMPQ
jgi:hypothetical protein